MSVLRECVNRLRYLAGFNRWDWNLDEEIRFHLETRSAELEAGGMAPAEAATRARREFGSVAIAQDESRRAWEFRWLEDFVSDLRHASRACRRSPAFALTAVISLALGIGGTTSIYTALDAVLWRPLPVAEPNRLVAFSITRDKGDPKTDLPAAFVYQLSASGMFTGVTVNSSDGLSFTYDGRAERIIGEVVSPNYFGLVGVRPFLGQYFTPAVQNGQWAAEAVLSYDFWQRRFGGDPAVIGRTIHLNTYPFTIVGVSPPSFFGLDRGTNYELRIPILPEGRQIAQVREISGSPERWLSVVARLRPGTTVAQVDTAEDALFQEFLRTTPFPQFRSGGLRHLQVKPAPRGSDDYVERFHDPLYVLMVLVAIVLLIACSNVAGMLLARAAAREREIAIRTSIGAGSFRLIRQMLAESLLLSVLGGALGIAVAWRAGGLLFRFLPQGHIHIAIDLRPDRAALLFTLAVSVVTGILFGLAPAITATRGSLAGALKSDSAAAAGSGCGAQFRRALVIAQVAFSLVLLVGAGVFARTLVDLHPRDYRSPDRVLLFTMKPQQEIYSDDQKRELAAEVVRRVSMLPGVLSAALAEEGPLGSRPSSQRVEAPGHVGIEVGDDAVTPGFFDTVGIPRIAGRDFNDGDRPGSVPVIVVNQQLARTLFPHQNPLGRSLTLRVGRQEMDHQIVGVVGDTRYYDVHKAPEPFLWTSIIQYPPYMPTLHVRTNADAGGMIAAIRRELDSIDRGFPVFNIRTMESRIQDSLANERMVAGLSGAFGILALVLAALGLYGILAYSVSRRTREIGIRMALGATPGSVLWMIAREALILVGAGGAAGAVLAMVALRGLARYLAAVSAVDAQIAGSSIAGMLLLAAAAVCIPAIRGRRISPLTSLRQD
jgi:macrolide transport system ATP-binding/permease protein